MLRCEDTVILMICNCEDIVVLMISWTKNLQGSTGRIFPLIRSKINFGSSVHWTTFSSSRWKRETGTVDSITEFILKSVIVFIKIEPIRDLSRESSSSFLCTFLLQRFHGKLFPWGQSEPIYPIGRIPYILCL